MQQLALEMALTPSYARADLAVTPANATLVEMLEAAPELHGQGILLSGPPGSGKTHLAAIWAALHGAVMVPPERIGTMPSETLLQGRARAVIDGIERVSNLPGLVGLLNVLRAHGGQVLITADAPPAQHPVPLADAQSRLMGLVQLSIPEPDDALLEAHLRKRFSDWHWQVDAAVMEYLLPRLPRDYAGLEALAGRLRAQMESRPQRLTIPQLKQMLGPDWMESGV